MDSFKGENLWMRSWPYAQIGKTMVGDTKRFATATS